MNKYQFIDLITHGSSCTLTLNRPEKRNALHDAMRTEILDFLERHSRNFESIIFSGAGSAFCAGKDLNEKDFKSSAKEFMDVVKAIFDCNSITIAAINGSARGGGLMIINACDFAIASENATFGMPDISDKGHQAFQNSSIQKTLQQNAASYLPLVGKSLSTQEAIELRLLNEVVEDGQLIERVKEICISVSEVSITKLNELKKEVNKYGFNNQLRPKSNPLTDLIYK